VFWRGGVGRSAFAGMALVHNSSQSRLGLTGANILGGGSRPSSGVSGAGRAPLVPATPASSIGYEDQLHVPPSASRTGRLYSDNVPSLEPHMRPAENVPALRKSNPRRITGPPEAQPTAVWSDSCAHLTDEWPAHAVPLFVFAGRDRPRPEHREKLRFVLNEEKYITYGIRLRCGGGDRYKGGTIGLIHSPNRGEALPGDVGQLATIVDIIAMPDNTLVVDAVGDLEFTVTKAWMPRGYRGLQLGHINAIPAANPIEAIWPTLASEPDFTVFARLLKEGAPKLAEALSIPGAGRCFTVFAPTNRSFFEAFHGATEEDLLGMPDLEQLMCCHVVEGKLNCEAFFNGRTIRSVCGTVLETKFTRWPRGDPRVNDIAIEHMDISVSNGVIHSIAGVLTSKPVFSS